MLVCSPYIFGVVQPCVSKAQASSCHQISFDKCWIRNHRHTESYDAESFEQYVDESISSSLDEINQAEIDHLLGTAQEKQKRASALLLLKMKESKQVVIDEMVSDWHSLFSHTTLRIQAGVRASLAAVRIDSNTLLGLNEVIDNIPKPFDGLETPFKQEKYYRESLFLVVSLSSLSLSHSPIAVIAYFISVLLEPE